VSFRQESLELGKYGPDAVQDCTHWLCDAEGDGRRASTPGLASSCVHSAAHPRRTRAGGTCFGRETVVEALDLEGQADRLASLFAEAGEEMGRGPRQRKTALEDGGGSREPADPPMISLLSSFMCEDAASRPAFCAGWLRPGNGQYASHLFHLLGRL
jgi:hypothetical protein